MSTAFDLVSVLLAVSVLYILAVAVKDHRVQKKYPILATRTMKAALSTVAVTQIGTILTPGDTPVLWLTFNVAVLVAILMLGNTYRQNFIRLTIEFMDSTDLLTIPTDRYVQVSDGIFARCYLPGTKAIVPSEKKLVKRTKRYDPTAHVFVLLKCREGGEFPDHIHPGMETLYVHQGVVTVADDRPPVAAGEVAETPAGQVHNLVALEYSECVAIIEK